MNPPLDVPAPITPLEYSRWAGGVDQKLVEHERRLDHMAGSIEEIKAQQNLLAVMVAKLGVKVAVGGAIGGIIGAGVVGAVVNLIN